MLLGFLLYAGLTLNWRTFSRGLSELNGSSVFPCVKCENLKTETDILAGDRFHVEVLVYASKAAEPCSRLKLGLQEMQSTDMTR